MKKKILIATSLIFLSQGPMFAQEGLVKGFRIALAKGTYNLLRDKDGGYKGQIGFDRNSLGLLPPQPIEPQKTIEPTKPIAPLAPKSHYSKVSDYKPLSKSTEVDVYYTMGMESYNMGDFMTAERYLKIALIHNPSDARAHYYISRIQFPSASGKEHAKRANDLSFFDCKAKMMMGLYCLNDKDTNKALYYFSEGFMLIDKFLGENIQKSSDYDFIDIYFASLRTCANINLAQNDTVNAKALYDRLASLTDLNDQINMSLSLFEQDGQRDMIIKLYELLWNDTKYPLLLYEAARVYNENYDFAQAVSMLDLFLSICGEGTDIYGTFFPMSIEGGVSRKTVDSVRMAAVAQCLGEGDFDGALSFLNTIPDSVLDEDGLNCGVVLNVRHRRYERALELSNKLVAINPSADNLSIRASCYDLLEMKDEAEVDYRKVIEIESTGEATWNSAWAYAFSGKKCLAKKILKNQLALNPDFYNYLTAAELYEYLGKNRQAKKYIRKAFEQKVPPEEYPIAELFFKTEELLQEVRNQINNH